MTWPRAAFRSALARAASLAQSRAPGPRLAVDTSIGFDAEAMGPDLDAYLARREARFADIAPGVQKRILWAGAAGARTDLSVVYIHGFSATCEEIRPVPDQVAQALGANLFYTRLAGHGLGGAALAGATSGQWMDDLAEALAIAGRIGRKVLVIATSTGATLAALGATDPRLSTQIRGLVMISPNFRIRNPAAMLLTLPFAPTWLPRLAGRDRAFPARHPRQATYWTLRYPTAALFPMAALVAQAARQDFAAARQPALFIYAPADRVVDQRRTARVAARWGGPSQEAQRVMGPGDDPDSHVIAGDILSPGQTEDTARLIIGWARTHAA
ncbi:hypothetical protein U879_01180 [Defluviimonas sp. 20V17]|uniref:Lysophospholipase n=1 Tax=Allgaiera indica TaxID=765699 RepID=A0AAN4UT62_9RHOB|nr:alpha/beta hydrolase [Allgaiera indica]KDB05572.1 hypothetical protein U879_01180 [Defluviimonas sp. 20V17]GHE03637.1 lysophospholipase [Allgaiera indica]SDX45320.1 Lysophospholipase, alpha-beta hydrolase superfamily [Allgaiera indica]